MWKLKKYVSNKNLITYFGIYTIFRALYLIAPLVSKWFIDSTVNKDITAMKLFAILNIVLFIVTQLVMHIFDILENKIKAECIGDIYEKIDYNLESYSIKNDTINRDRINQEISDNLKLIEEFIFIAPVKIIFSIVTIIAIFIIMYNLSVGLSLIMVFVIPAGVYISYKLGHLISDYSEENIINNKDIKGYLLDKHAITKSERLLFTKQLFDINILVNQYKETLNKKYKLESFVNNLLIYFILNGVIIFMQLLSGYYVFKGIMTIGTFFAAQLYVSHFWTPVEFLFIIRNRYLTAKPAINSFVDFMDIETVSYNDTKIKTITLDNIQCTGKEGELLNKELSTTFDKKYINIITGDNGTGKTTLVEAILGYNNRYKGNIYINNEKLDNSSYLDIVYMPGDYLISNYGILSDMVNLSSGQKKKAQIDLSLRTDKSVYIIDEPTNYLDKENKRNISDIINNLYEQDKIVIVITHDIELIDTLRNSKTCYLERNI